MRIPRMTAVSLSAALALAGCMSDAERSPTYEAGYSDGCATASAEGTPGARPQRDTALYQADADYRAGWAAGHGICRRSNESPRR